MYHSVTHDVMQYSSRCIGMEGAGFSARHACMEGFGFYFANPRVHVGMQGASCIPMVWNHESMICMVLWYVWYAANELRTCA